MSNILLVEDDVRLSQLICDFLSQHEHNPTCFNDGNNVLQYVVENSPDIIILDVMLPGDDGFSLCKQIRQVYQGPVLFMTAKSSDFDQVLGLELGGDDYIIKPVEPRVLLARINALLRRVPSTTEQPTPAAQATDATQKLVFGQLSIDKQSRQVMLSDQEISLTSHEFDMLWKLASNPAQLVERSTLYSELIGREYDGLDRSADVRISRLRKKLNDNAKNPYRIKTIWGKGFFFVPDAWDN